MAVLKYKNGEGQFVTLTNYTVQPITPVQTTGDSLTDIMSQKAVSDEVNKKVNEAELDGKIADAISGNPTVKNAIADVIGDNAAISGAVEDIAEGAADAKIAAYDEEAVGKFAAKDHNHDDVYAPLSHTHNVADINNFSDEVADAVKTEITNNNSAITESIENVVEKYIYGGDAPSSATVITTENMETKLGDYAKNADLATVAKSGDYNDLINLPDISGIVETSIAENEAVKQAIASAIDDDDSIQEAIENAVSSELDKKADTSAVTASIEAATSGKVDTTAFNTYSGEVQTVLNSKFDGASYDSNTKKIKFKNGETVLAEIDATDFIKDGMVDNVVISGGNLVITFNEDAGRTEDISIALTDIFDPSNYYNKTEADGKFLTISSAETLYVANDGFDDKVKGVLDDSAEVSGSVIDIIENYITGASSNIYTKEEANGAFQAKGDYVSASTFNEYTGTTVPNLLDEKADVEHTHYASAVTDFASAVAESVSGNASVSGAVEEIVNDKLDGYYTKEETDNAIASAITEATFESSQISDLADAVSGLVANNEDVKNEIIKEVTESQTFTTLSGDVYTISGDVIALSGEVNGKQDVLVSGDNIKTVNGESLLGSGNVDIIDQTLDSGSTKAIANSAITIALIENEEVVSSALNDLNTRILTHSGNTDIHVTAADKTAWNAKSDFSGSYNDLEDVPSTFAPSAHEHASNEITSMSGYTKPNATSAIETGDTLNQAIGKLEKAVESATAGGVNSVSLTSGTNNGTLKLTVNTTETDNIAVTGLGGAAFLNTGTTVGTVADGGHHHNASAITDFDNAVADAVSGNSAVISSITKVITGESAVSGAVETIVNGKLNDYATKAQLTGSSDYLTVTSAKSASTAAVANSVAASGVNGLNDAIVSAVTGNTTIVNNINSAITSNTAVTSALSVANSAKTVTDFYVGHNSRTTLANVPTTKRLVIVTDITSSTNALTLNGTLSDGYEIHLIIQGTAGVTITIPSAWVSLTDTIAIGDNGYCELNIISDGSKLYVRGA